jgi:twinkle protein
MSSVVNHVACPSPNCSSTDGYSVDPDTGWGKCFVCNYKVPPNGHITRTNSGVRSGISTRGNSSILTPVTDVFHEAAHRSIPLSAIKKYQIDMVQNDDRMEARYPYFIDGKHVANKLRTKDKKFGWEYDDKDAARKVELFGQHLFPIGSAKQITLVEGEYDAPAAFTLLGSRYPVVSVASAGTAMRDVKNNFEYLDSFENIVVCLDGDEVGRSTAKQVAELFKPGKCRLLDLQECKDPNAYLAAGKSKQFVDEWYKAPAFMPDGLKIGSEMWDEIINRPKHFQVDYPFHGLNKLTYGLRLSEMVVVTAETGIGKTSILKKIEYSLLMNSELKEKNYGVGFHSP